MSLLLLLGITGLLVALPPLAVVLRAREGDKYRKLVWITLFLTLDLIMFGAFTRLTDSGLGCPDWPGCYGHANPLQAHEHISAAQAALPSGPVTVMKAWIEMIHRYLAMAVGVLIIAIMAAAWRRWLKSGRSERRWSPGLPTFLFFFVCLQGAFGAWTVTLKLQPAIVTMHLLLGMALLGLLGWLAARQQEPRVVSPQVGRLKWPAMLALGILAVQIALGGWVSTNYAALACTEFPTCQGVWLPSMDFANGFTLWRHLGKTGSGDFLPFPALVAIHWTHRLFAFAVIALLVYVGHKAMKIAELRKLAHGLLIVLALQFATGVSTVFFNWPLALAVVHNGGAALLVLLLTMLNYRVHLSADQRLQTRDVSLSAA